MQENQKRCYVTPAVRPGTIETNMHADGTPLTVSWQECSVHLTARKITSFIPEHYRMNPIDLPIERPYPDCIRITVKEMYPSETDELERED